jgi:hypothetical protein
LEVRVVATRVNQALIDWNFEGLGNQLTDIWGQKTGREAAAKSNVVCWRPFKGESDIR